MTEPAAPDRETPADPAQAVLARQIEMLGELAELALDFARTIKAEAEPGQAADSALAFNRAAKAVRMTLMLQAELNQQRQQADKPALSRVQRHERVAAQKDRLERIIDRVAEREGRDPDRLEGFHDAVERLDDEDLYGDILTRPLSDLVAEICQAIGLTPDWPGLAEEVWAQTEIASGNLGWPLADWAARPDETDRPAPKPPPPSPLAGEGRRGLPA